MRTCGSSAVIASRIAGTGRPFSRLRGCTGSRQVLDRAHPPKDSRASRPGPNAASVRCPPCVGRSRTRSAPAATTQKSRRRPIFPKGCPLSIFGAGELNFRVRDGNGCGLSAGVTGILRVWIVSAAARHAVPWDRARRRMIFEFVGSQDLITISQPPTPGQVLKRSSPRPLVPLSFIRHRTSTCGLSNRWSPCGLTRLTRWGTSSRGELRT